MPHTVHGLPTHVLLVHAVVVLVPLAAALLVLAAASPRARARLGIALPALAAACVVLVPVTASAGQWLRGRIGGGGPLVARHQELAEALLPWVVGVLVLSLVVWARGRQDPVRVPVPHRQTVGAEGSAHPTLLLDVAVLVLCAVVAVGAVVQVVRVGESGSQAVWDGVATATG